MDSYNSRYPSEYYEIGTPYMFYISSMPKHGVASEKKDIDKYGKVLERVEGQVSQGYHFAKRYVGVVVGKSTDAIHVMFMYNDEGRIAYITVKYAVSYTGVFCDDKEQYSAGTIIGGYSGGIVLDIDGGIDDGGLVNGGNGGILPDNGNNGGNGGIIPDSAAPVKDGGVIPDSAMPVRDGGVVPDKSK